jgi:SAM-dependent methyltransferase
MELPNNLKEGLAKAKQALSTASFRGGLASTLLNPFHLTRTALFRAVKANSDSFQGQILDVGCGSKPYRHLFKKCSNYVGVDVRTSGHNHNTSKIDLYFDGLRLPFSDGSFDSVVSFEVLEHVFEPRVFMKEISRVTKLNGYVMLTVPFVWPEHEKPYDYARYTTFGLTHLAKECGMEPISLQRLNSIVTVIFQLLTIYVYDFSDRYNKYIRLIYQIIFIAPITLVAIVADTLLPKSYSCYGTNILLAKKVS